MLAVGCERSGNTWVGKMLGAAPGTVELYQPFNGSSLRPATPLSWPFTAKDQYIGPENGDVFRGPVRQLVRPRIPPEYLLREAARAALGHLPIHQAMRRYVRTMHQTVRARIRGDRMVMGDPGGIFLAEWLADTFDAEVVCLLRHPCGVAAGFKRMGWVRDMSDLLEQPLLMDGLLAGWRGQLEAWNDAVAAGAATPIQQAVLWWNLVGHVMAGYRRRRSDFHFVRYEDLATNPIAGFRELYARVGLSFTPDAEHTIRAHTGASGGALGASLHVLRRNSAAAAESWRERLTAAEIEEVLAGTATVAEELGGVGFEVWAT